MKTEILEQLTVKDIEEVVITIYDVNREYRQKGENPITTNEGFDGYCAKILEKLKNK